MVSNAIEGVALSKDWPTWKTVTLGQYSTGAEYEDALMGRGRVVAAPAHRLLCQHGFIQKPNPRQVELVQVTVKQLGLSGVISYQQICSRANELGLVLCSPEVAPALRLVHVNPASFEFLVVASKPLKARDGELYLLGLADSLNISLDAYVIPPVWLDSQIFVFEKMSAVSKNQIEPESSNDKDA